MTERDKIIWTVLGVVLVLAIFWAAGQGPDEHSYAPDAEYCVGPYCY